MDKLGVPNWEFTVAYRADVPEAYADDSSDGLG
jgi:hypothetical protein